MTVLVVLLYLAAIVAANLSTTHFGPEASVVNAFLFIGLNFTARDVLHDSWQQHRALRMGTLIVAGGVISYAVNADAARIALASCVAFTAAEAVDYAVYTLRLHAPWLERSNESNVASSAVDSIVFPAIAFGSPLLWLIVFGQFTAKVAGGFVWSLLLRSMRRRPVPA